MKPTIIQIPVTKRLRDRAKKAAEKQGFSSLQEIVRVFLNQLAEKNIEIGFTSPTVMLSAKNNERYAKMIDEVKSGKVKTKTFSSAQELMNNLQQ